MSFDVNKVIAEVAEKGDDQSQAQKGGTFEVPAAGFTRVRFVGYYETGNQESEWKGVKKVNAYATLVFELSGPKHPPREHEGNKYPILIKRDVKLSKNDGSNCYKLFSAMNWEGKAKHFVQLLGNEFAATVEHNVVPPKKPGQTERTFANLIDIRKPFIQAMNADGDVEEQRINVDAAISPIKLFVWDFADAEMWDSIFIEGEYEEKKNDKGEVTSPARSKNVWQNQIRRALNYKGLPCYDYAESKVTKEDSAALDAAIGDAEEGKASGPDDLDGVA